MPKAPSSNIIEKQAVNVVESSILKIKEFNPCFTTDDKNIGIDGYIQLYKSDKHSKDNSIGSIPVQIKGQYKKSFKKTEYKRFSLKKSDLKWFVNNTIGILFFYVMQDENDKFSIYYKKLSLFSINEILKKMKDNKSSSVKFKRFPTNTKDVSRLIKEFNDDLTKQANLKLIINNNMLDKLTQSLKGKNLYFEKYINKGESILDVDLYSNGGYIYTENDLGEKYVVDEYSQIDQISLTQNIIVSAGSFSATINSTYISNKSEIVVKFGGFTITTNNQRSSLALNLKGSLEDRIRDLELLKSISEHNEILINGRRIGKNLSKSLTSKETKNSISRDIEYYKKVNKFIKTYDIKTNYNFNAFEEKDFNLLSILLTAFIDKKELKSNKPMNLLKCYKIHNGIFVFVALKTDNGLYKYDDYLSPEYFVVFDKVGDEVLKKAERAIVPLFYLLNSENYTLLTNLNHLKVKKLLYSHIKNKYSYIYIRQKIDDIIDALNNSPVCPEELYLCALETGRFLHRFCPDDSESAVKYFMLLMYKRRLNKKEIEVVKDMITKEKNNISKMFLSALLGKDKQVKILWKSLSKVEQIDAKASSCYRIVEHVIQ